MAPRGPREKGEKPISPQPSPWRTARVQLATAGQTRESVQRIVEMILGHGGCYTCGRLIRLDVEFAVDPGPELGEFGVISVNATGAEE